MILGSLSIIGIEANSLCSKGGSKLYDGPQIGLRCDNELFAGEEKIRFVSVDLQSTACSNRYDIMYVVVWRKEHRDGAKARRFSNVAVYSLFTHICRR